MLKALSPAELIVVDRNPEALKLAVAIGADHGVVADGTQVEQVLELTGGHGAEVVVDFVGEGGATAEGVAMLRRAGDYHVVGYGENIDVPTIDIVSTEINFIGNLVGSYNDLCDLMALAARGAVKLHTQKYAARRLPVRHRRSRRRPRPRPGDPHPLKEHRHERTVKPLLGIGISVGVLAGVWTYRQRRAGPDHLGRLRRLGLLLRRRGRAPPVSPRASPPTLAGRVLGLGDQPGARERQRLAPWRSP